LWNWGFEKIINLTFRKEIRGKKNFHFFFKSKKKVSNFLYWLDSFLRFSDQVQKIFRDFEGKIVHCFSKSAKKKKKNASKNFVESRWEDEVLFFFYHGGILMSFLRKIFDEIWESFPMKFNKMYYLLISRRVMNFFYYFFSFFFSFLEALQIKRANLWRYAKKLGNSLSMNLTGGLADCYF